MKILEMTQNDIQAVVPIYLEQYNEYEGGCWTAETAGKRIFQTITINDAFSLIMKDELDNTIGFVMGYFRQYDDLVSYILDEIVIAHTQQRKGYGSLLMTELEKRVQQKGASGIELTAVKDDMHDKFYDKAGFKNAGNFTLKCKWFV